MRRVGTKYGAGSEEKLSFHNAKYYVQEKNWVCIQKGITILVQDKM